MRRITTKLLSATAFCLAATHLALAETWIRVEAHPTVNEAVESAQEFEVEFDQVGVFAISGGWYAIAIGPFDDAPAPAALRQYRSARQIPADSFLVARSDLGREIWSAIALGEQSGTDEATETEEAVEIAEPVVTIDETPAEARRSERQMSRSEKEYLQEALKWAGFYRSAIDGDFGPGTRRAMGDWQTASGFDATGVMTTGQRQLLIGQYEDFVASLGMEFIFDQKAGIEIALPLAQVEFDRYDPPFAIYRGKSDPDIQVLLISQTGDRATMAGLYEVMQTLKIVPNDGPRKLNRNSFTLVGESDQIVSETFARTEDGYVKGFTLVYPQGEAAKRDHVFDLMASSYRGDRNFVLPDVLEGQTAPSIDLLAGLEVRRPIVSASGFFVDGSGNILTSAGIVANCDLVTFEDDRTASIVAVDKTKGLALVRSNDRAVPVNSAQIAANSASVGSPINLAGYSFGGRLDAASLTTGTLDETADLSGNTDRVRISLPAFAGDVGGPLLNASGHVVGMLLPPAQNNRRQLPDGVHFAASSGSIVEFLSGNGVNFAPADETSSAPDALALEERATGMTVLVECWD